MNRRESPRIDIRLGCHVTSPALWRRSPVHTENISRRGLLLEWPGDEPGLAPPEVGQILAVEIELPAYHDFTPKCIHCEGTVARVSNSEGPFVHVALRVNYMAFRSLQSRLRAPEFEFRQGATWMA